MTLELAPADAVTLPFTPVLNTEFRMIVMLISMLNNPSNVLFFPPGRDGRDGREGP